MSIIKIEDLSFAYPGGEYIFKNLDLRLDSSWRLGLVGRNGRGKSSLLRLLMGELEHEGRIISPLSFEYFPRAVSRPERPALELLEELTPGARDWERERELGLLGFDPTSLEKSFSELSKGEGTKLLLSALFLNEGSFPLIDEPTNHLDAQGRRQAARYLRGKEGFILVSHDRDFLDGCADHILALNRDGAELQSGNFSSWYTNFRQRQDFEQARERELKKEIKRLRQAGRRNETWSDRVEASKSGAADRGYVGHKAAKMMKRAKSIETRQQRALDEKEGLLKNLETAESLKLFPLEYPREALLSFSGLVPRYGDRAVCAPLSYRLRRGERLSLLGSNGSGKSSLLKLLTGRGPGYDGELSLGSGLSISYVGQDTDFLSGPISGYAREMGLEESLFRAVLHKLGFEKGGFGEDMEKLSAGQKKKILLAGSLCQRAHLYLWDEPLNFIDLYSRVQLEELILRFAPSMIFVEHDAAFTRTVATGSLKILPPEK